MRMTYRDEALGRVADVRSVFMLDGVHEAWLDPGEPELLGRLAELIAERNLESATHMQRVGEYSALLARASGLDQEKSDLIGMAAPLHDVGKVGIADEILTKRGELDADERREMERHAQAGHDLLADATSDVVRLAAEIALTHHERYDGTGYPRGLAGEAIPVTGRITAVADVFDALVCDRPYRRALTLEEAVKIMLRGRGTQFDPDLIDSFMGELDNVLAAAAKSADIDLALTR
jgi:putative two-component system response regulator